MDSMADIAQSPDLREDADLSAAAARGEAGAFEELYRRHVQAAWRVAMSVTGNREDAADVVAEAFTRVFAGMPRGGLSSGAPFRPYVLTATRNAAIDVMRRSGRTQPMPEVGDRQSASDHGAPAALLDASTEASFVAAAFAALPERWREVLWLTEVEGMPPRAAAAQLGLSPNGVAQLAVRARAALREQYLQAHLRVADGDCAFTTSHLAAYVGGGLSARDLAKVDQHLAGCGACKARLAELEEVGSTMRRVLLPLPIGLAALAAERFASVGAASTAAAAGAGAATAAATTATAGSSVAGLSAVLASPAGIKAIAAACALLLGFGAFGAAVVDPQQATERALGKGPISTAGPRPSTGTITPIAPVVPSVDLSVDTPIRTRAPRVVSPTTIAPAPQPELIPPVADEPPNHETPRPDPEPLVQVNLELSAGGGQGVVIGVGLGDGSCVGVDCGEPGESPGIGATIAGTLLPALALRLPPG
jgi:trimeric autotransporter adhesin